MRLDELVRMALEEDVGPGDVTTEACVPAEAMGSAAIVAKAEVVVAGHEVAAEVFRQVGAKYTPVVDEGEGVSPGTVIARVAGPARAMLTGERLALNFLMRLCGIATHTRATIGEVSGIRVVDTRKTTPLLRAQERKAVCLGGGANHRFALYDGVLIKDNHIVAAGGVKAAVEAARGAAHHLMDIEVEIERLDQLAEALEAKADTIMLDNMDDATVAEAVARIRDAAHPVIIEVSGNITATRLPRLAAMGVDVVSIGGLIHQARWVDLSMRWAEA